MRAMREVDYTVHGFERNRENSRETESENYKIGITSETQDRGRRSKERQFFTVFEPFASSTTMTTRETKMVTKMMKKMIMMSPDDDSHMKK